MRILELGCGCGWFTRILQKQGEVVPTDKRKNDLKGFVKADARNLPFDNGEFDMVAGHFVLHHIVGDLPQVFKECSRVLRPKGRIYFIEPNGDKIYPWIWFVHNILRDESKFFKGDDERAVYPKVIEELLKKEGFKVKISYKTDYLPIIHSRLSFIRSPILSNCMIIEASR